MTGEIKVGPVRLHWFFADEDPGFVVFSFKDNNVELGQVDQERPGIYLTSYNDGEVIRNRTLLTF